MMKETNVLFLGYGGEAAELISHTRKEETSSYCFLGYFSINGNGASVNDNSVPFLGRAETLKDYILRNPVDMVVALEPLSPSLSKELLEPVLEIGLTVAVPKRIRVQLCSGVVEKALIGPKLFLGSEMLLLSTVRQKQSYVYAKRFFDVAISGSLLIAMAPLLASIAIAIKLTSPNGSVFYPWRVLGKNGRPFVGYKFRTMVPNADQLKQELLPFNEMQGPVFKMRNDPRVTRLGRFLRRFSLDELPQLYSVLKGDMSLVGPRPPYQKEAERFAFWQRRKLSVKPGITCLWQVNGRNEITEFDQWARMDLEYIERASLLLDLKILFRTILVVLQGHGAY